MKRADARWEKASAPRLLAPRVAWRNGEWDRLHPDVNPRHIKRHLAA
ncbi:MAG: hypothetical protein HY719_06200 [Planctomycetes bacterium]|nr:hypothetical protein [Planctomycetota bacterium]